MCLCVVWVYEVFFFFGAGAVRFLLFMRHKKKFSHQRRECFHNVSPYIYFTFIIFNLNASTPDLFLSVVCVCVPDRKDMFFFSKLKRLNLLHAHQEKRPKMKYVAAAKRENTIIQLVCPNYLYVSVAAVRET